MVQKKDCVIAAVATFAILAMMKFMLKDKNSFKDVSSPESPCIRFCCFNMSTCNYDFIKANFNGSWIAANPEENPDDPDPVFKIMFGHPTCSLKVVDVEYEILSVSFENCFKSASLI